MFGIVIGLVILGVVLYHFIVKPKHTVKKRIREKFELCKLFLERKNKIERDISDCKIELGQTINEKLRNQLREIEEEVELIYLGFEPSEKTTRDLYQLAIQITDIRKALASLSNLDRTKFDRLRDDLAGLRKK